MSTPVTTVAVISAGAMGSAIASVLHRAGQQHSFRLLSDLEGRSASTLQRAHEAGLQSVSLEEIAHRSDIILSVLPPSEAVSLARRVAEAASVKVASRSRGTAPSSSSATSARGIRKAIYCDMNAVSPKTASKIAEIVQDTFRFVDGCIIGGPPKPGYQPTIYVSGDDAEAVAEVENTLSKQDALLKIRILKSQGIGAASALKLSYAGMTKGFTALASTMILAAAKQSPETAQALLDELADSRPDFLRAISRTVPDALPKAHRFVGEMEEIAAYVDERLGGASGTYRGMAELYQRLAEDRNSEGQDGKILGQFSHQAKTRGV